MVFKYINKRHDGFEFAVYARQAKEKATMVLNLYNISRPSKHKI